VIPVPAHHPFLEKTSMKFSMISWRGPATRALAAALLGSLLAACGGGDQIEKFQPTRVVSFGDETSALLPAAASASAPAGATNAVKYTVNALVTGTTTLDCAQHPLWNQIVAGVYGLVLAECNPTAAATTSTTKAAAGARVADVAAQIDAFMATDSFDGKTLVTVLAGQHDVLAQHALVEAGTASETDATAAIEATGAALAAQVNRIAAAGGKVIISTIPNVAQTPLGRAEDAPGNERLSRLTAAFNARLRVSLTNDGRKIGLILLDEAVDAIVRLGSGFSNTSAGACNVPVLQCTTSTLVTGATASSYLWADPLFLTPEGQRVLGSLAAARAQNNPF
jgi:outer membrane lipase/esterase